MGYLIFYDLPNLCVWGWGVLSPSRVPEILTQEIRDRTNIGMFDEYNLMRYFLCTSLVRNHSRECFMGVQRRWGKKRNRSRVFLEGRVLRGGTGYSLHRSSEGAKTFIILHKISRQNSEITSPSGILGVWQWSEFQSFSVCMRGSGSSIHTGMEHSCPSCYGCPRMLWLP